MAGEQDDDEDEVATAHGPRECMPCRGTGKLISNLGGEPSTVVCPWCAGGGVRLTDVDAQAKWPGGAADAPGGP
jgi:DnaJ-class molecular chaperone